MSLTLTKAQQAGLTRAQRDPAGWVRAFLGDDLWEKQIEILESVRDNRRTAVKSCFDSGKSHIGSRAIVWYLETHPDAIAISTAPTYRQVRNNLWRPIATARANAIRPLLGRALTDRYEINHQWYGFGFKADDNASTNFQGIHPITGHILVVIDEGAGVPQPVFDGIEGLLTSEHARLLILGNPTSTEGEFYDAFHKNRGMYHCISISADDTPNLTEGRTVRPYLITQAWIDDAIAKHGEDSPYVQARVHARFSSIGDKNLIPLAWIERAHHDDQELSNAAAVAGLDCAEFGGDENALCVRRGFQVVHEEAWSGVDLMETVGRVRAALVRFPDLDRINIDANGIGAGVWSRLRELHRDKTITYKPVRVISGEVSSDPIAWANLRHELWWKLKERFRERTIVGPFSDVTMGQLSSIRYRYHSAHTHPLIETKLEMRRRKVASPDRAEAIMMAFADIGRSEGKYKVSELTAPAQTNHPNDPRERDRIADQRGGRGGSLAGSRNQVF